MVVRRHARRRTGGVLIWVASGLMFVMLGFAALAADLGHLYATQADLMATAEASSLAAAEGLTISTDEARARAHTYARKNMVNGSPVVLQDGDIELGIWDSDVRTFTPVPDNGPDAPNSARVTTRRIEGRGTSVSLFFARIFGLTGADVEAKATAYYQPRDIMIVNDYSGSMNDDSELQHINRLGQAAVEANLLQIFQELGSPTYGTMQFDPVFIASTNDNVLLAALGLTNVPYPYPSGSWVDYFDYVQDDDPVNDAGYGKHYGYLTLVNYWLAKQPRFEQTPDLWMTSEQPLTAVKDAVTLFLAFLTIGGTNDYVGLSAYTYTDRTAIVDAPLTDNFVLIDRTTRERQAAHYHNLTNIGAGIQKAYEELDDNGRRGTFKMIVLITDGKANLPVNRATGRAFALDQAREAAQRGYAILTISLGADADTGLMDQIASLTNGVHFNVPGGQSVSQYEDDLNEIFLQLAQDRPLKLVQ